MTLIKSQSTTILKKKGAAKLADDTVMIAENQGKR